jgi:hypothetical protein
MKGHLMHLTVRMPVTMLVLAAVGCAPSSPSRPTEATTSSYSAMVARDPWGMLRAGSAMSAAPGVKTAAVIDGFRVHPDPGDDGVIRVVEGESVSVNASDIASRPPAPQSFLVVKWGDGPANQRVGCGPCRMDHSYAAGRYTLVASADGLPGDRSITLDVEVRPGKRDRNTRFQYFGFDPEQLSVGGTGRILFPFPPPGLTQFLPTLLCEQAGVPTFFLIQPNGIPEFVPPDHLVLPFIATGAGTCTFSIFGEDADGTFTETSTLTIVP